MSTFNRTTLELKFYPFVGVQKFNALLIVPHWN